MPTLATRPLDTPPTRRHESGPDPYIRLSEVLRVHHCHPPTGAIPFRTEPESADDCMVVRLANIKPFRLSGDVRWVAYHDVEARFAGMRGSGRRGHLRPYSREEVFAPAKLILAEDDHPVRAALTHEPAFPWQNKIAVLRPGQSLWLMYAALAILNTEHGAAYYERERARRTSRSARPHGLKAHAVNALPVARRGYPLAHLAIVARLAHQLTTLYEAQSECVPAAMRDRMEGSVGGIDILSELEESFRLQIGAAMTRLSQAVCRLLGLSEDQEHSLLSALQNRQREQQPPLLEEWDMLDSPPPLPPVQLLSDVAASRLQDSLARAPSARKVDTLRLVRFWEEAINRAPPQEMPATTADRA